LQDYDAHKCANLKNWTQECKVLLFCKLFSLVTRRYTLGQCFSTLLLQRNLPLMLALLMEPYAMIQLCNLLQPHRAMVANLVPGNFGLFLRNPYIPRNADWKPLSWGLGNGWT